MRLTAILLVIGATLPKVMGDVALSNSLSFGMHHYAGPCQDITAPSITLTAQSLNDHGVVGRLFLENVKTIDVSGSSFSSPGARIGVRRCYEPRFNPIDNQFSVKRMTLDVGVDYFYSEALLPDPTDGGKNQDVNLAAFYHQGVTPVQASGDPRASKFNGQDCFDFFVTFDLSASLGYNATTNDNLARLVANILGSPTNTSDAFMQYGQATYESNDLLYGPRCQAFWKIYKTEVTYQTMKGLTTSIGKGSFSFQAIDNGLQFSGVGLSMLNPSEDLSLINVSGGLIFDVVYNTNNPIIIGQVYVNSNVSFPAKNTGAEFSDVTYSFNLASNVKDSLNGSLYEFWDNFMSSNVSTVSFKGRNDSFPLQSAENAFAKYAASGIALPGFNGDRSIASINVVGVDAVNGITPQIVEVVFSNPFPATTAIKAVGATLTLKLAATEYKLSQPNFKDPFTARFTVTVAANDDFVKQASLFFYQFRTAAVTAVPVSISAATLTLQVDDSAPGYISYSLVESDIKIGYTCERVICSQPLSPAFSATLGQLSLGVIDTKFDTTSIILSTSSDADSVTAITADNVKLEKDIPNVKAGSVIGKFVTDAGKVQLVPAGNSSQDIAAFAAFMDYFIQDTTASVIVTVSAPTFKFKSGALLDWPSDFTNVPLSLACAVSKACAVPTYKFTVTPGTNQFDALFSFTIPINLKPSDTLSSLSLTVGDQSISFGLAGVVQKFTFGTDIPVSLSGDKIDNKVAAFLKSLAGGQNNVAVNGTATFAAGGAANAAYAFTISSAKVPASFLSALGKPVAKNDLDYSIGEPNYFLRIGPQDEAQDNFVGMINIHQFLANTFTTLTFSADIKDRNVDLEPSLDLSKISLDTTTPGPYMALITDGTLLSLAIDNIVKSGTLGNLTGSFTLKYKLGFAATQISLGVVTANNLTLPVKCADANGNPQTCVKPVITTLKTVSVGSVTMPASATSIPTSVM